LKAGIAVAIGIIVGDIIYVLLVLKGIGGFLQNEENSKWMALIGGLLLIGMGIKYLFNPSVKTDVAGSPNSKSLWVYALNGFLINFVNPFVFGVWVLFLTLGQSKFNNETSVVIMMTTILVVIFATDILKAFFAHKLKKFMNPLRLKVVYKIFGVIMILFGGRLIFMFL
ncbi:MAG: LysE family translocator, partial [Aurantibacter sp.]